MLDEADLRAMSPHERYRLARMLAALDLPPLFRDPKARVRRNIALSVAVAGCLFLCVWIGILAVTLPATYRASGWRAAWIGFDVAELLGFAAIAWTAWKGKQLLIVCLVVTATLLCADAWFDLTLDWGSHAFYWSLISALCAELPLAALMIFGARRLLRLTVRMQMVLEGLPGPVPPLWRVALFGEAPHESMQLAPATTGATTAPAPATTAPAGAAASAANPSP
jgi:hypothetical protein